MINQIRGTAGPQKKLDSMKRHKLLDILKAYGKSKSVRADVFEALNRRLANYVRHSVPKG